MKTTRVVPSAAMQVDARYPQLRALLWSRSTTEVTEEEAFALYEAHGPWVERARMSPEEGRLFDALVARFGRGVFLG